MAQNEQGSKETAGRRLTPRPSGWNLTALTEPCGVSRVNVYSFIHLCQRDCLHLADMTYCRCRVQGIQVDRLGIRRRRAARRGASSRPLGLDHACVIFVGGAADLRWLRVVNSP
jgi:hypothetical protein